jgi:hypothetical protein
MKKIFTLSVLAFVSAFILAGCYKNSVGTNENYWLSQERGDVVYSDSYCSYFVIETNYGYTIMRSRSNSQPYEGSVIFGDFGRYGTYEFYNQNNGRVFSAEVIEIDLTYTEAQYAVEAYCPSYGKGAEVKKIIISNTASTKAKRPAN